MRVRIKKLYPINENRIAINCVTEFFFDKYIAIEIIGKKIERDKISFILKIDEDDEIFIVVLFSLQIIYIDYHKIAIFTSI